MRFKQITFSIGRAMPLYPLSGDKADEYANVKPHASVTIEFDDDDPTHVTKENFEVVKQIVNEAFSHAEASAFASIQEFSKNFRELYKERKKRRNGNDNDD